MRRKRADRSVYRHGDVLSIIWGPTCGMLVVPNVLLFFTPPTSSTKLTGQNTSLVFIVLLCSTSFLFPVYAEDTDASAEFRKAFDGKIRVFLDDNCTGCHCGDEPEAGMPLDNFDSLVNVNQNRHVWLHVVEKIRMGEMPPEDEIQPSKKLKDEFLAIVESELGRFDCRKHVKPGRVTIRRLNRFEYNNTIRDLLAVDFEPAAEFPADDVGAGFDNLGDVLSLPPLLMEKYLDAASEIAKRVLADDSAKSQLLIATSNDTLSSHDAAELCIEKLATRAFRRPLQEEERKRLVQLFNTVFEATDNFEESISFVTQAVLVSPSFLFRIEYNDGEDFRAARPLNDFEVATRLSYFLWSSIPDDELFDAARNGKLTKDDELAIQVGRMLADPKSETLVNNFATQWLELKNLEKLNPGEEQYPEFDEPLRTAMRKETESFIRSILREDRSVLDMIDADFTFVNERLARHYGIEGVQGEEFQRVSLQDNRRGGILTQASILTLTSNPTRTSPVKRGKWILDNILGEPPPPPPPGVEELDEGDTELLGTLRERMKQHRDIASCAVCHNKMDALGFGFENFDGIGSWRDSDGKFAIDASGELPGKLAFNGPAELREILKNTKKDQFVRCLTEKLLTYALGRMLGPEDRCTVDLIVAELKENDFRFSVLVQSIVSSDAFRMRGELGESK